ncbi:hypothetical protein C8J55DRAFT_509479 [Lentinula edodes]|uniref:Uncharacterized protein n=1 Tax=Lentinula lateritia TaxID=40482 RepID=A0A9W9DTS7_9AGAR|nr:hypothetical protein C8J55DRAFT_509479 [Lentinula edodes]
MVFFVIRDLLCVALLYVALFPGLDVSLALSCFHAPALTRAPATACWFSHVSCVLELGLRFSVFLFLFSVSLYLISSRLVSSRLISSPFVSISISISIWILITNLYA